MEVSDPRHSAFRLGFGVANVIKGPARVHSRDTVKPLLVSEAARLSAQKVQAPWYLLAPRRSSLVFRRPRVGARE